MTNIRAEVWRKVDSDPSLKLDLERGLLNVRALARHLAKQGVNGTEDAIISAVRRYPKGGALKQYAVAQDIVSQSKLSTKSGIANIAIMKGSEIQEIMPKLFSHINYERGETLRLVQGEESIKLLVDEKNADKILELIPKRLVIGVRKRLAEINMHLHPLAVKTPGIVFLVAGELARNGVPMYEIMSCVPEMLIFVDEKDLLKAYEVLFAMTHIKE